MVVDLRSLRPLDTETVAESVGRTNRAVLVEEGWSTYGVTAEPAARIQRACLGDLDAPVERVGSTEVPLPYGRNFESAALPNEGRIAAAILETARPQRMTETVTPRPSDSTQRGDDPQVAQVGRRSVV